MVCVGVGMCGFFIVIAVMMDKEESTKSRGCYQGKESGSGDSLGDKSMAHSKNEAIPKRSLALTGFFYNSV